VNSLDRATAGDRGASARYRDVMQPLGLGDELRAAVRSGPTCWGVMCLHRSDSPHGFTASDAALVAGVSAHIAEALRRAVIAEHAAAVDVPDDGPGVIVVAPDLTIVSSTPAGAAWLAQVAANDRPERGPLPVAVRAAIERLRGRTARESDPDLMPRVRVQTPAGRWLVIHAAYLDQPAPDALIAVVIEPARPPELASVVVQAYALTPREAEVAQLLLLGLAAKEVANRLRISTYTVNDHVKSIFDKTGARSRGELLATIFHMRAHAS
jgi:DNA-binding CsgD family transcriptional regulator